MFVERDGITGITLSGIVKVSFLNNKFIFHRYVLSFYYNFIGFIFISTVLLIIILPTLTVCEYYAHADCVEFALANCKEIDVYVPGKQLSLVIYEHHWREGNLPSSAKCTICKKTCWSSECLSGYRCEWCGICVSTIF